MARRIGILISAADYAAFRELMPGEARLGENYADWKQRRLHEDSRTGERVKEVPVFPKEFRLYCLQIAQKPSYSVLEAFVVKKSHER